MIKEALEYLEDRFKPTFLGGKDGDDPLYSDKTLHLVAPPHADCLKITTLTGLVDFIKSNIDRLDMAQLMVLVINANHVRVVSRLHHKDMHRNFFIEAVGTLRTMFNNYISVEEFIIGLQVGFVQDDTVKALLRLAGNIEDKAGVQVEDDGVTQRVTAKTGIARLENVQVPNPVVLRPFRTFREVDQPRSPFIFRVKSGAKDGALPQCMLRQADGDEWALEAIQNIKAFILEKLPGVVVIA